MTNVLIVEDEPAISDMERDFLEGAGYNPFIAENSEEALHMMRSEKIDAVILDVTLPGEDGFSLCRKLREITNVPILFAAARTEDSDIVRGLGLGADDYLPIYVHSFLSTCGLKRNNSINPCRKKELLSETSSYAPKLGKSSLMIKMYCLQAKNLIFSISLPHIPMKYFQKSSCSNRYGA